MYLLIDLSSRDSIHLALFDEYSLKEAHEKGVNRELLFCIDRFLRQTGVLKEDVHGIMVVTGAGGFTSARIATTVANTFAYILYIPLLAIIQEQVSSIQRLIPELLKIEKDCLLKLEGQRSGQYISATYSGEPNIGGKNIVTM